MRNFFKDKNNNVFEYDDEQVSQGYGKDLTPITEDEMKELTYVEPVIDPKTVGEVYTLNGVDYQVPFLKDDADGIVQVTLGFMKGAFTETVIHFSNGAKMPITSSEFDTFALWFADKRNSFFIEV